MNYITLVFSVLAALLSCTLVSASRNESKSELKPKSKFEKGREDNSDVYSDINIIYNLENKMGSVESKTEICDLNGSPPSTLSSSGPITEKQEVNDCQSTRSETLVNVEEINNIMVKIKEILKNMLTKDEGKSANADCPFSISSLSVSNLEGNEHIKSDLRTKVHQIDDFIIIPKDFSAFGDDWELVKDCGN